MQIVCKQLRMCYMKSERISTLFEEYARTVDHITGNVGAFQHCTNKIHHSQLQLVLRRGASLSSLRVILTLSKRPLCVIIDGTIAISADRFWAQRTTTTTTGFLTVGSVITTLSYYSNYTRTCAVLHENSLNRHKQINVYLLQGSQWNTH